MKEKLVKTKHLLIYNLGIITLCLGIVLTMAFSPFIQIKSSYGIHDINLYNFALAAGFIKGELSNGMNIFTQNLMPLLTSDGSWLYVLYSVLAILLIITCLVLLVLAIISLFIKRLFKTNLFVLTCGVLPLSLLIYWSPLIIWILTLPIEKTYDLLIIPFIPEIIGFVITLFSVVLAIYYYFNFKDLSIKKEAKPIKEINEVDINIDDEKSLKVEESKNPAKTQLNESNDDKNPAKPNLNKINLSKIKAKTKQRYGDNCYLNKINIALVVIEDDVESIGNSCFEGCVNLKDVTLGSSLKKIGKKCFYKCEKLEKISYNGTIENFKLINRGPGWLAGGKTRIIKCLDGEISVNPYK